MKSMKSLSSEELGGGASLTTEGGGADRAMHEMKALSAYDAIGNVIASIALQEAGLAHVVNAGSEVIGNVLKLADAAIMEDRGLVNVAGILSVSASVREGSAAATQIENELHRKLCCSLAFMKLEDALPEARAVTFRVLDNENWRPVEGAAVAVMGRYVPPEERDADCATASVFTRVDKTNAEGEVTLMLPADQTIDYIATLHNALENRRRRHGEPNEPNEHTLTVPRGRGSVMFDGESVAVPTLYK